MAKIPEYATYLYSNCIARKEMPDSEYEGCDEKIIVAAQE